MRTYFLALGMAVALLAGRPALADEVNLPGHLLSDKDASARANNVFLGQLVSLDRVKTKEGKGEYIGKVIYVSRSANGITPYRATQDTTAPIPGNPSDLSFPVTLKVGANESAPEVGKSYLIYGKDSMISGIRGYDALKLVPTADHGLPSRIF
jgi:hypothetical protein